MDGLQKINAAKNNQILVNQFDIFLFGFFVYCLGYVVLGAWSVVLGRIVQMAGIVIFCFGYAVNYRWFHCNSRFLRSMVFLFVLYGIIIIFRGHYDTLRLIANKIYDRVGIFRYLLPLVIFLPVEKYFLKILKWLVIMLVAYIFCSLSLVSKWHDFSTVFINGVFYQFLGVSSIALLYFWRYLKRDWKIVLLIALCVLFVLSAVYARRGHMLDIALALFLNVGGYYVFHIRSTRKKINIILATLFLAILSILPVYLLSQTLLTKLIERGTTDTRSIVDNAMITDFNKTSNDYIYGRGIDGEYLAPYIETNGDEYRYDIETAYLGFILKGGIIYLALFLLIIIPAIVKGLRSKNYLSIQCALFVLQCFLSLYHHPFFAAAPMYFMLWVCIAIIYKNPQA